MDQQPKCYRVLGPLYNLSPTYRMDRQPKIPTGTWSFTQSKSYLRDGPTTKIPTSTNTWPILVKHMLSFGLTE